jgi:predicted dehydrogenase
MCFPLLRRGDIRWRLDLAGGSLMDAGCYTIHQARTFAGDEPSVTSARAKLLRLGVDRWFRAELSFSDGPTGQITASMLSGRLLSIGARVEGSSGVMRLHNPLAPHIRGKISIRTRNGASVERADSRPTYLFQLRAFAAAVLEGRPFPTDVDDAVANMTVIDACYRAAGLEPRRPAAVA